jgi:non-specific serine/threonine protein kinase/serine/threonine-protein kinase
MSLERCPTCGGMHLVEISGGSRICTTCLLRTGVAAGTGDPLPGAHLLDHVRILNVIGEGPRGRVLLAEWTTPGGGLVALKCVPAVRAGTRSEPRLASLDHPSIATIHEMGTSDAVGTYVITDYVPGPPVTRFCDRNHLPPGERVELWLQAAEAIAYAHAKGLPHLNVKPTNVLVAGARVFVLDFERALPAADTIPSSPYRAPEQAAGQPDARSDLFALGVLLSELLAGLSRSKSIDDLILHATRESAEDRLPSVSAFAAAVRAWLQTLEEREQI